MSHYGNGGNNWGGYGRRDGGGWGKRSDDRSRYEDRPRHDERSRYYDNPYQGSNGRDFQANQPRNGGGYSYGNDRRYDDRDEHYHNNNRKRDATYSIEHRAAAKKPSHTHHNGESLTPQAQNIKQQMEELSSVNNISAQAFMRPEGWDKTAQRAVEATEAKMLTVLAERKKKEGGNNNYDADDSDSDCYTPVGVNQDTGDKIENSLLTEYIRKLPSCHRMFAGFFFDYLPNAGDDKICACPCSKYGIEVGEDVMCEYSKGDPSGLMAHLKTLGGLYDEKDKKSRQRVQIPLKCEYHYAANIFLREAFADYHGSVGHKALYPMGSQEYHDAIAAEARKKQREKQTLISEKEELKLKIVDLESNLDKINEELFEKEKRWKDEMKAFNVVEKKKAVLTDDELKHHQDSVRGHFDVLRYLVDQGTEFRPIFEPVKICVKPDPDGRASFSFQFFLDSLYERQFVKSAFSAKEGSTKKENASAEKDFERCYDLFFGDICSVDEAKTKKNPKNNITMGLISEWNVVYTKTEECGKTKKAKDQLEADTAIDQGGPSRQFISDAILQMQTLSVPVEGRNVTIFCQVTAGKERQNVMELIPRMDFDLEREVRSIAREKSNEPNFPEVEVIVESAMSRIKDYSRVLGRLLLHAFICDHPVSSAVMTPFYMNLLLRGVIPGDVRYDRGDVLRDIDGVLCVQSNTLIKGPSYWLEDGDVDDDGNPWTIDTIFSKRFANEFINTRFTVLSGMVDGLSLRGKRITSVEELHEGSELRGVLGNVPIGAIAKILFARPILSYDDVYESLCVVYNQHSEEMEGTQDIMDSYRQQQEQFYETVFLPYIQEEAEKDCKFLSKFVECCTGSSCLPYAIGGASTFQITVKFNLGVDSLAWPNFHTCSRELVLSGHVYVRDSDSFREMMNEVIEHCRAKFEMQ